MDTRYDFNQHEPQAYDLWQRTDSFNPDSVQQHRQTTSATITKQPFCIMMPPPNANDPLHVGHAMFIALEDVLIRYHRMLGDDTLWLPGTDHAGIETQFVYEKKLKKQGKSRFDFDRETLYQNIWDYVQENSNTATDQMKKIGASADWSRFVFMLDERVVEQVVETFGKLNEKDLVYRDFQMVNYCTHCGTAFSNLEVKHIERKDPFYYMKYGPFTIGTVRPETKFRDTALAVHPDDERYAQYIGQTLEIQGLLGPITMTVIADEGVDPEFGTGIMKVTPAHDPHDFELGKKHNLPVTPIIKTNGRMDFSWYLDDPKNDNKKYRERAEKYHNTTVHTMRKLMKEDLEADGLLEKYDPNYTHTIGVCYRCKRPIEPLPLPQFFVRVRPLVEPILSDLQQKKFAVHGAGHDKILKHWLENLNDWNVSRQIVWGIRMPVWYDIEKNNDIRVNFINSSQEIVSGTIQDLTTNHNYTLAEISAGLQELQAPFGAEYVIAKESPGPSFIQETDTFDTWFSSSQWPFTTLRTTSLQDGKEQDFERFYPTQVMETGYDILPFWVMRMLFMGKFATNELPFTDIYLHGLVRDQKGQKMSKSKGNVINPLEVIEKYGADALRMALVIRSSAGLDKSVGDSDFKAGRNLANKIWNAARFIITSDSQDEYDADEETAFRTKLQHTTQEISQQLTDLKIGLAADTTYNTFWHWFCDECIEKSKQKKLSTPTLLEGLTTYLKLLHPFMPFVTEAVWQELYAEKLVTEPLLITAQWPV